MPIVFSSSSRCDGDGDTLETVKKLEVTSVVSDRKIDGYTDR